MPARDDSKSRIPAGFRTAPHEVVVPSPYVVSGGDRPQSLPSKAIGESAFQRLMRSG